MAFIEEDRTVLNSMITKIRFGENIGEVETYDKSVSTFSFSKISPSLLETNNLSKNYVHDKNTSNNVDNLTDVVSPKKFDYAKISDGSSYIYDGTSWLKISRDMVDMSTSIDVPDWKEGSYPKFTVVRDRGLMFIANKDSTLRPSSIGSTWTRITEYDLFKKRCELDAPKLFGYFDVSGPMMVNKEITLNTKDDILNWFSESDIDISNVFSEDSDGMYILNKPTGTEFNIWRNIDTSIFRINRIKILVKEISGTTVGSIIFKIGDVELSINDINENINGSFYRKRVLDYRGNKHFDDNSFGTSGEDVEMDMGEVRINHNYSKINIKYKYSDSNISRHRISSVLIEYEEME